MTAIPPLMEITGGGTLETTTTAAMEVVVAAAGEEEMVSAALEVVEVAGDAETTETINGDDAHPVVHLFLLLLKILTHPKTRNKMTIPRKLTPHVLSNPK